MFKINFLIPILYAWKTREKIFKYNAVDHFKCI